MANPICDREFLRVEIVSSAYVDDKGQPEDYGEPDIIGYENIKPYWCTDCGHEFDTFEEAMKHFAKQRALA